MASRRSARRSTGCAPPGCTRILVVPLYPQYASSTTGSVADAVAALGHPSATRAGAAQSSTRFTTTPATSVRWPPPSTITGCGTRGPTTSCCPFMACRAGRCWPAIPYHCYCQKTARLLARELGLEPPQWTLAFQSRFGRGRWLEPYTADVLAALGRQKLRRVDVAAPGFVADCLETLEELGIEGKRTFQVAGGGDYNVIPCLNEHPAWIAALADLVAREPAGLAGSRRRPRPSARRRCCAPRRWAPQLTSRTGRFGPSHGSPTGILLETTPAIARDQFRAVSASPGLSRALKRHGCGPICATIRHDLHPTNTDDRTRSPIPTPRFDETPADFRARMPLPAMPLRPTTRCKRRVPKPRRMKDAWLRARAETENVRRQGQADVAKAHKYADREIRRGPACRQGRARADGSADAAVSIDTLKAGAELTLKSLSAAFERRRSARSTRRARSSTRTGTRRCRRSTASQPPSTVVHGVPEGLPDQRPRAAAGAGRPSRRRRMPAHDRPGRLIRSPKIPIS